jgi:hypothetical protein
MSLVTTVILLILCIVFLLIAAISSWAGGSKTPPAGWMKLNFLALGLACWVAVYLLRSIHAI